jgi:hypothetical protein
MGLQDLRAALNRSYASATIEQLTEGRVSRFWTSQDEARAIVAEHGCRLCTWHYPGEVMDVSGDLWCHHCVREAMVELPDLAPARIPRG